MRVSIDIFNPVCFHDILLNYLIALRGGTLKDELQKV